MARGKPIRGVGSLTAALTIYDIWRRLPPAQRRWLWLQTKRHGPRVMREVLVQAQKRARKR
jgi:hypothetical protein